MTRTQVQTNDFLEKESIGKLMRKFTVPCIISLLVAALYNIVDQIFIANANYLGSYGNAANTVVYPLTVVALAIAVTFGDGTAAFFSLCLGAKENDSARRSVGSSVISVITIGVILAAVYLIFQQPILSMFGAGVNEETFRLSKEYFFWISLGIPVYMLGQTLTPIISSDGSPKYSMCAMLVGTAINIILDPIFIYVFEWGMMGAAVATIIGQAACCLIAVGYLFRMKAVKLGPDDMRVRWEMLKRVLPLGMTSFFAQVSIVLSMAAVLNMVKKYGQMDVIFAQEQYAHIPTAVIGIVMKFFQIIISIAIGLSAGSIPITGYNMGARRNDRVKELMKRLIIAEVIVGAVALFVFELFPNQLIGIFGAANESVYYTDFAVACIRIFLSMIILACVNKGTSIFLQGLGKATQATSVSVLREILFGVGLPILLPVFFGLDGILYFMPVADILTFIVTAIFIAKTNAELSSPAPEITLTQNQTRLERASSHQSSVDT
ncbi:MAG: MATE family efflux transporter, partial [Clostridia bacterium]|nr:MATE family efflux transporter [Clostridia bacterium]